MRKRVVINEVPGSELLGGDGDQGAGDLSWAPPDEVPADPTFEQMWEATADMELEPAETDAPGGDDGGVLEPQPPVEDVPALPETQDGGDVEEGVPTGPGDGAGSLVGSGIGPPIPDESWNPPGTSPVKALTGKLKKERTEMATEKNVTKSPEHRAKLQAALKKYWAKRRKEGGGGKAPVKAKAPVVADDDDSPEEQARIAGLLAKMKGGAVDEE